MPAKVEVGGPPRELPQPPEDMPEDARKVWEVTVPRLAAIGLLDVVDSFALEAMCTQWARAKQAGRVLAEQGMVTLGSTGQLVEHPALASERQAHQMFLRLAEQYALTPVARTRLGLAELKARSIANEVQGALSDTDDLLVEID
jgi:P27 family predicted phage terminase small subunit